MGENKDSKKDFKMLAKVLSLEVQTLVNALRVGKKSINDLNEEDFAKIQTLHSLKGYIEDKTAPNKFAIIAKWLGLLCILTTLVSTFFLTKKGIRYSGEIHCDSFTASTLIQNLLFSDIAYVSTNSVFPYTVEGPSKTEVVLPQDEEAFTNVSIIAEKRKKLLIQNDSTWLQLSPAMREQRLESVAKSVYKPSGITLAKLANSTFTISSVAGRTIELQLIKNGVKDSSIFMKPKTLAPTIIGSNYYNSPEFYFNKQCKIILELRRDLLHEIESQSEFQDLSFYRKSKNGVSEVSSVLGGTLQSKEFEQNITLNNGDNLSLELRINKGEILIRDEGKINLVLHDAVIDELKLNGRVYSPSLFIYYYKSNEFKFQVGLILFLISYMTKIWTILQDIPSWLSKIKQMYSLK